MAANTVRAVLGVYADDDGESAKAYEVLRAEHLGEVYLFRANETETPVDPNGAERYGTLRLEGECLIVVEAAPSKVPAVVKHLQSAGSPAVFVVSEGLSDLAVPEMAAVRTGSEPIEEFAR